MSDTKPIFTIDDLLAKTPDVWKPVVAMYGPKLAAMTAEDFAAWIKLLLQGKTDAAWAKLYGGMTDAELVAAGQTISDAWGTANAANAQRIALGREAAMAVMRVLLSLALAMVGL